MDAHDEQIAQFAEWLMYWAQRRQGGSEEVAPESAEADPAEVRSNLPSMAMATQGRLFVEPRYREEAPTIESMSELAVALDQLEYQVFRRFHNHLTRAERSRLDNAIMNISFKVERFLHRLIGEEPGYQESEHRYQVIRDRLEAGRREVFQQRDQLRRLRRRREMLDKLKPEQFEEFVGEVFEAYSFQVEHVGGTDDQGIDLHLRREGLHAIVQCKHHRKTVVGSPEMQRFLGSIEYSGADKGFFVSTSTFSLSAERFVRDHPIELIDGPTLSEMIDRIIRPIRRKEPDTPLLWGARDEDDEAQQDGQGSS